MEATLIVRIYRRHNQELVGLLEVVEQSRRVPFRKIEDLLKLIEEILGEFGEN